jgi:LysM repeat protein
VKKRRGCIEVSAITVCVLVVLALVALGIYAVLRLRQQQLQTQFEPPSVTVTYPASGTSTLAGSYLPVSATAFGGTPIERAELWVDGELIDTQESRHPEGVSPFYASFDLTVSQGLHTLFVRAVDVTGLLGDSWPVNVGGVERPGPHEPALVVTVEASETVEDIAAAYDVDAEDVRQLNPGLGNEQPPEGSEIVLPLPRTESGPGTEGQAVGPTLPTGEDQPPAGNAVPPPTGARLSVVSGPLPISIGPLLALLSAGSPPAAPTDLQAEVTDCTVRLRWDDNADNEERYEVWYLWNLGQDSRKIAELEPAAGGQAWFEFPAPSEGAFILWVEAINFWGRQASNKVGVLVVGADCPQTLATQLEVKPLDMTGPGGYEDVYCYLSFEGTPHVRVPSASFFDDFVQPVAGVGNVPGLASGEAMLAVPIPGDESLEVQGECWGWSGGKLDEIGTMSGAYPRQTWDGTRLTLAASGLEIGLAIRPLAGAVDTSGQMTTFSYDDPTIPVPYDVFEDRVRSFNPVDPMTRSISWKWDGDPNSISGFQILLNGAPYNVSGGWSLVAPTARGATVMLPRKCGAHISWQVRAIAGQAQSTLSALTPDNDYDLPQCPEYAMVNFYGIQFEEDCDFYPAWFLSVNGQVKEFNASCDTGAFTGCLIKGLNLRGNCGPHYFADWGAEMDPYPDTIVVPISLEQMDVEIKAAVWDRVSGEMRAAVYQPWTFTSLEDLQQRVGCGKQIDYPAYGATLWFTLYVFPTPEGLNCDVSQPAYIP